MVVKRPAASLERCPEHKSQEAQRGCCEKKNEEDNEAEEDLEGVEGASLLESLGSLLGGGLAQSNDAIKKPEARQDECPSHSMDACNKPIRKWRYLQGHAFAPFLSNNQDEQHRDLRSSLIPVLASFQCQVSLMDSSGH